MIRTTTITMEVAIIPTSIDPNAGGLALIRLLAWASPSFPVGAFSYSHGLEAAVEAGLVHDLDTTTAWVVMLLTHGAGRADAIFFRHAHGHAGDWVQIDRVVELADASRASGELALESTSQGRAFLATIAAAWPDPYWDDWRARLSGQGRLPPYAVAFALAAARAGIAVEPALAAFLHGFAANLVSAAVRLIPLGQTDGQRATARLEAVVQAQVAASAGRTLDDVGTAVPASDWCSLIHETQYTRLFRS